MPRPSTAADRLVLANALNAALGEQHEQRSVVLRRHGSMVDMLRWHGSVPDAFLEEHHGKQTVAKLCERDGV